MASAAESRQPAESLVGETIALCGDEWLVTPRVLGVGGFARVFQARGQAGSRQGRRAAVKVIWRPLTPNQASRSACPPARAD